MGSGIVEASSAVNIAFNSAFNCAVCCVRALLNTVMGRKTYIKTTGAKQ